MNTSYEKLSFYNNYFGGYIDGDNILSTDFYGNKTIVGVTSKKYKDTVDLLNTYYNKLVELGVIEKEKTPEDLAKEQQQMMQENNVHKEEKVEEEPKEKETVNLSAESLTDIAKMVASMIESSGGHTGNEHLHEKYHELDKRIAVCEALLKK